MAFCERSILLHQRPNGVHADFGSPFIHPVATALIASDFNTSAVASARFDLAYAIDFSGNNCRSWVRRGVITDGFETALFQQQQ